jgi:hypothetical protein
MSIFALDGRHIFTSSEMSLAEIPAMYLNGLYTKGKRPEKGLYIIKSIEEKGTVTRKLLITD